jgi:hypothetical protein
MRTAVLEASLLLLLASVLTSRIDAYPTRAGHCATGAQIGELSGGVHDREGSGSLEDHNFTISFDDLILKPGEVLELVAGKAYDVTFGGTEVFLGFLLRVSGLGGEELQDSLTVADKESQLLPSTGEMTGFASACAENVAGLCHTTRDEKYFILTEFRVDVEAEVRIEVTIMTQDTGAGNGNWFFSSYRVNVRPDIVATSRNITTDGHVLQGNETSDGGNNETMTISQNGGNETTEAPSEAPQDGGNSTTDASSGAPQDGGNSTTDAPAGSSLGGFETTEAPSIFSAGAEAPAQAPSVDSVSSLPACKWFCALSTTIPWKSSTHSNPKCDWTFSCSACPECRDSTG